MNEYEEIINTTSNLIYHIINKYFKGYEKEDLYQVGVIGVIKAYNNYKEDKSTKFSTYAYKYIYGEIYSYINSNKTLKLSKEINTLYNKINKAKDILSQKLMKEPSTYELSLFLEIEESLITNILNSRNISSIDDIITSSDNNLTLSDTISDKKDYYNIDYLLLNEEIETLEYPEKEIMKLRYFEDKTQSEVAQILGINQVQVSRYEGKTLKRIRKNYQNVA